MGEAPVLVHGDKKLSQSGVILTYLAERSGKFKPRGRRRAARSVALDHLRQSEGQRLFGAVSFPEEFCAAAGRSRGDGVPEGPHRRQSRHPRQAAGARRLSCSATGRPSPTFRCVAYLYYPAEEFGFDIAATHKNIARVARPHQGAARLGASLRPDAGLPAGRCDRALFRKRNIRTFVARPAVLPAAASGGSGTPADGLASRPWAGAGAGAGRATGAGAAMPPEQRLAPGGVTALARGRVSSNCHQGVGAGGPGGVGGREQATASAPPAALAGGRGGVRRGAAAVPQADLVSARALRWAAVRQRAVHFAGGAGSTLAFRSWRFRRRRRLRLRHVGVFRQ